MERPATDHVRAGRRTALARHHNRGPRRHRLRHSDRMGARRPGHHVRRWRHDHRLSHDPARGRQLHPVRLRLQDRLRRGRTAGRQGAGPPVRSARADKDHPDERHRRPRPGHRLGRLRNPGPGVSGRQPGLRRRGDRRYRPGQPGDPDLHLGHHRSPEGSAADSRRLDLRGQGGRNLRHHRSGRTALPVAALEPRVRQGADHHSAPDRVHHRHRRPDRQDRRQSR